MEQNYKMSSAPHIHSKMTTGNLYVYMILSLLPTVIWGIYTYEVEALIVLGITIGSAVFFEYVFQLIFRKVITIGEFHSVYLGLLLALNLPSNTPWWICLISGAMIVLVFKPLRLIHPVAATMFFVTIIFGKYYPAIINPVEQSASSESVLVFDLFIGNVHGTIGTSSVVSILIGAAFLVVMEVIDIRIPLMYIVLFLGYCAILSSRGLDVQYLATQLCSGTFMFGVWFLAPDHRVAPITKVGRYFYGIILGIFTAAFRVSLGFEDGVMLAILVVSITTPLFERIVSR